MAAARPIYVGRNHFCGQRWWNGDPCGLFCAFLTYCLLGYAQFCILTVMMMSYSDYPIHQTVNFVLFEILWGLALTAHVKTMLTDPGTVPKGTLTEHVINLEQKRGEVFLRCTKCSSVRPERAHHCSVCDRCIRRMDHHCPWVNNCVGEGNQKYFILFTLYISLVSFQTLYWTIWQFVLCIQDNWQSCSLFSPPSTTIIVIFLLFESILFAIFTIVMFGTQISSICSDQTGIESLKNERGRSVDGWKNLQVVFGGPLSHNWFNPLAAPFVSDKAFEFSV
uniref:Palmitoyltransferase n=1 Tax=Panagrellus redivivus TaxID=6233 RepID=A0A7E4UMD4_PANRE